eukprot:scaffold147435_cov23-Prasinocladus_malaysianus.AAC.1
MRSNLVSYETFQDHCALNVVSRQHILTQGPTSPHDSIQHFKLMNMIFQKQTMGFVYAFTPSRLGNTYYDNEDTTRMAVPNNNEMREFASKEAVRRGHDVTMVYGRMRITSQPAA